MELNFKRNRKGNYTAKTFTIFKPKTKGGQWLVTNGSARRKTLGAGSTLAIAKTVPLTLKASGSL